MEGRDMTVKTRCWMLAAVLTTTLVAAATGSAYADDSGDATVTAADVATALRGVPGVLADSDTTKTTADTDSAAAAAVGGTTVDVPRDADAGVNLSRNGTTLTVTPPNAEDSGPGTTVAPGVIAYPSGEGAATAVQITETGDVRMFTVIDSSDAATAYTYDVSVPAGGHIARNGDGAVIVDAAGTPVASVAAPWAKDAHGTAVPTHFDVSSDEQHLTQVIEHTTGAVAYPVTADPWWSVALKIVKFTAKKIGPGAAVLCLTGAGWAWYRSDSSGWLRVGDSVAGCIF
jgi:hypothetical protein